MIPTKQMDLRVRELGKQWVLDLSLGKHSELLHNKKGHLGNWTRYIINKDIWVIKQFIFDRSQKIDSGRGGS